MECERQPDSLVGEKRAQLRVEAFPGFENRHQLEQIGRDQINPALERLFQERSETGELLPVGHHEPRERATVGRRQPRDLRLHLVGVGRGEQFPTGTENKSILWVEADHLHLPPQVVAPLTK